MYSKVISGAVNGIDGVIAYVEADVHNGLPGMQIVGDVSTQTKEAKDRVRAAIENAGFLLPPKRITVNIFPGSLRKAGTSFDLPIAISVLSAFGCISEDFQDQYLIIGELTLDGHISKVNGVLSVCLAAKNAGIRSFIVPKENVFEASLVDDVEVFSFDTISQVINFLNGESVSKPAEHLLANELYTVSDKRHCIAHSIAKDKLEALVIAATGGHGLLIVGNDKDENFRLSEALHTLLPDMENNELQHQIMIRSVNGLGLDDLTDQRPFLNLKGEPELMDYADGVVYSEGCRVLKASLLERMQKPYELVCGISPKDFNRISEVRSFFDICLLNGTFSLADLNKGISENEVEILRQKIRRGQKIQKERYAKEDFSLNAELKGARVFVYANMDKETEEYFETLYSDKVDDMESLMRLLKVSRTIADLEASENITLSHIKKAYPLILGKELK